MRMCVFVFWVLVSHCVFAFDDCQRVTQRECYCMCVLLFKESLNCESRCKCLEAICHCVSVTLCLCALCVCEWVSERERTEYLCYPFYLKYRMFQCICWELALFENLCYVGSLLSEYTKETFTYIHTRHTHMFKRTAVQTHGSYFCENVIFCSVDLVTRIRLRKRTKRRSFFFSSAFFFAYFYTESMIELL